MCFTRDGEHIWPLVITFNKEQHDINPANKSLNQSVWKLHKLLDSHHPTWSHSEWDCQAFQWYSCTSRDCGAILFSRSTKNSYNSKCCDNPLLAEGQGQLCFRKVWLSFALSLISLSSFWRTTWNHMQKSFCFHSDMVKVKFCKAFVGVGISSRAMHCSD